MQKPQTLADLLGTTETGQAIEPNQLEDFANAKDFAERVLRSSEFRTYIINGLRLGEIPSAIVTRLMDYGWGKPIEHVEVSHVDVLDTLSDQELEARYTELLMLRRTLREHSDAPKLH